MIKVTWISDVNNKPNLKLDFATPMEKYTFLNSAKAQAATLDVDFPLVNDSEHSLLILDSEHSGDNCGCYISQGKLAINFGNYELKNTFVAKMKVNPEHAEMWMKYPKIYFHLTILPAVNSAIQLAQKPQNNSNNQDFSTTIKLTAHTHENEKPLVEIEFNNKEKRDQFLDRISQKATTLGVFVPFIAKNSNKVIIIPSNYPNQNSGCYLSKNKELAINFGTHEFREFVLNQLEIHESLGVKPKKDESGNEVFYFHTNQLSTNGTALELQLKEQNPQKVAIAVKKDSFFNNSNKTVLSIDGVKLTALGSKEKVKISIEFKSPQERALFLTKVSNIKGNFPLTTQEPNKVIINSSNYPLQCLGCYFSQNNEVAVNFGTHEFRNVVLNLLGINETVGTKPPKNMVGQDVFYFHKDNFGLNDSPLTVGSFINIDEEDYLRPPNGIKAINYVFTEFLQKPYNDELKEPQSQDIKNAWAKHKDWDSWYTMSLDWSLTTPSGEVQRPNHGLAHTLRVAQLVPVIAEFLKAKYPLTTKEIQQAQYMMLFSVIGRENDMSWTDANHYQQAYFEAKNAHSEHLYDYFKKKAEQGFINHVNANQTDLIPALFANNEQIKYWAKALNTGKPGIETPAGILMAMAHDLDLMRCYEKGKFKSVKMTDFANKLGDNETAEKLANYAHDLIVATGDRCIGYGFLQNYNDMLFGQCSIDPQKCLEAIQNVPKPTPTTMLALS